MEVAYSWFGISGLIAGSVALIAVFFILRDTPDALTKYLLAGLISCESVFVLTSYAGPAMWFPQLPHTLLIKIHAVNDFLIVSLYLPTLARVVDTPLLRPFRKLSIALIPIGLGVSGVLAVVFGPTELVSAVVHKPMGSYPGPVTEPGPVWGSAFLLLLINYTYGLVATLIAWRRAESTLQRRKSGLLALAFGARDITFGTLFAAGLIMTAVASTPPSAEDLAVVFFSAYYLTQASALGLLFNVVLMAYGVLSVHVFDIDLKVKWTISRGTVTAAFIAIFFIFSEGAAAYLSDQFGLVFGLLATGSLLFFLAPIQRWAERISNATLPGVEDSPEYLSFRKMQIYSEAVMATVRSHNAISPVDRALLDRLCVKLGLSSDEVSDLEQEILNLDPT